MPSLVPALLGLLFGVRHALEPDHLAAVSTLASEQKSLKHSLGVGLSWGLGHALTLVVFGGFLSLFEVKLPQNVAASLEIAVACVIIALGVRAVKKAIDEGKRGPVAVHVHQGTAHAHPAASDHFHVVGVTLATRPLLVGALHGLAGSGALVALVLLELDGFPARLLYLALFGLGATLSMGLLTALAGVPLTRLARARRLSTWVLGSAGALSICIGLWWAAASASTLF